MKVDVGKLREIRESQGKSMTYMAKRLGYKYTSGYANIEYGLVNLSLEKAWQVASILSIDVNDLFLNEKLHEKGNDSKEIQVI